MHPELRNQHIYIVDVRAHLECVSQPQIVFGEAHVLDFVSNASTVVHFAELYETWWSALQPTKRVTLRCCRQASLTDRFRRRS